MASILWLALASCIQLMWGLYPVVLRFCQTVMPHKLTSLQLTFLINVCACPALLMQSLMQALYGAGYRRGAAALAASADAALQAYAVVAAVPRRPRPPGGGLRRRIRFQLPRDLDAVLSPRVAESPRLRLLAHESPELGSEPVSRSASPFQPAPFILPAGLPATPPGEAEAEAGGGGATASRQRPGFPRVKSFNELLEEPERPGCCRKLALLLATTASLTSLMGSQIFALMFVEVGRKNVVFFSFFFSSPLFFVPGVPLFLLL